MRRKAAADPVAAPHAHESENHPPRACHRQDTKTSYDERLFTT
jgi:hypothetical protein